ncbi:MAG: 16S rRNA (guanine(527)-N(7))-methyltransferase RsmG [Actinobacteria bacterium]|nr:16S rRNA (guanine(527)-N(7))-methyltransferase RsmG [Actinomycetota bacterium]
MAEIEPIQALAEGAERLGVPLDEWQVALFVRYKNEIQRWNRRLNLTAIDDDMSIVVGHFLDSLAGLAIGIPSRARVVDVGAGAGLPGLALKIARPDISLLLIEATRKKASFLQRVSAGLELEGVSVAAERVELIAHQARYRETFDVAVARALAHLSTVIEYALPLVKTGGRLVAYKAERLVGEVEAAGRAVKLLGGSIEGIRPAVVPFLYAKRYLVVATKEVPTDERYPRRVGIPSKRPLGA